jgi:P27 family predicted phage terminase small subunit
MPRRKPAGTAADPRNGEKFALVIADGVPKCDLPAPIADSAHPIVKEAFERYWFDPISAILQESDYVLVQRYFSLLNRYFTVSEEADSKPVIYGVQGGESVNPKYVIASQALTGLDRIERQLGIGPANRARLGLELVAADEATKRGFERGDMSPSGNLTLRPRSDPRDEDE